MRVYFNTCAVKTHSFQLDFNNVFPLQPFKKTLKNSIFAPAIHSNINCMPIPVTFRQCPPFTAVFRDIQDRIYQLEVAHAHIPALTRQIFFDFLVLFLRNFHIDNIASIQKKSIV